MDFRPGTLAPSTVLQLNPKCGEANFPGAAGVDFLQGCDAEVRPVLKSDVNNMSKPLLRQACCSAGRKGKDQRPSIVSTARDLRLSGGGPLGLALCSMSASCSGLSPSCLWRACTGRAEDSAALLRA